MAKKPKGFGKFDALMRKLVKVPPPDLAREIASLEASIARYDEAYPEDVDPEEYQSLLDRLVALRKINDADPCPMCGPGKSGVAGPWAWATGLCPKCMKPLKRFCRECSHDIWQHNADGCRKAGCTCRLPPEKA